MTLIIAIAAYVMFRLKEKRKGQFKTSDTPASSIAASSSLSPEILEIQKLQGNVGAPTMSSVGPKPSTAPNVAITDIGSVGPKPSAAPRIPDNMPNIPDAGVVATPVPTVVNVSVPPQAASAPAPVIQPQPVQPTAVTPADPPLEQPAPQPAQPQTQPLSQTQSAFLNSLKVSGAETEEEAPPPVDQSHGSFRRFQVPKQKQAPPNTPPSQSKNDDAMWK